MGLYRFAAQNNNKEFLVKTAFRILSSFSGMGEVQPFVGKVDVHRSVTVSSLSEGCTNVDEFTKKLEASLRKWESEKLRGVWFHVHLSQGDWISVLGKYGFTVHHGKGDHVDLVKWLPQIEKNSIPPFAHNLVGAGAIVLNEKDEILSVRERYSQLTHWKLPGGYVEPYEDIGDAAQREVLEETNIQTEFVSLIAFRHSLKAAFGCSDLYFIVLLKPTSQEITKDASEVEDCQWINIHDFVNHPEVNENNKFLIRTFLENRKDGIKMSRNLTIHPISKQEQKVYTLSKS